MFCYIYNNKTHTDITPEYMVALGMDEDAISSVLAQKLFESNQTLERRRDVYRAESDPLFIEWQYDLSVDKEMTWRKKVEEIKSRYPKL